MVLGLVCRFGFSEMIAVVVVGLVVVVEQRNVDGIYELTGNRRVGVVGDERNGRMVCETCHCGNGNDELDLCGGFGRRGVHSLEV